MYLYLSYFHILSVKSQSFQLTTKSFSNHSCFPQLARTKSFLLIVDRTFALLHLLILSLMRLSAVQQFISSRGNEYFCEIDEDYLTDRFNLTGLNTDVLYYQYALDLITDVFELECDDDMREQIEKSARHLYGLIHARFITTTRGLAKMVRPLFLHSQLPSLTANSPLKNKSHL